MSSIRQFRNLASQLFKVTLAAQRNDVQETNKHVDGMLDCIAELLECKSKDEAPTLSTVSDHALSEMAFGKPMFMMDPYSMNDPLFESGDGGPRLVIHDPPTHDSPTIKVTKIGSDSNLPTEKLDSSGGVGISLAGDGTSLESLFLGVSPYGDEDIDHESIRSDDVGVDIRDSDDEEEQEEFEELKIPFDYEGKQYVRGIKSQRVFDTSGMGDKCVGVWVNETFVPLIKTVAQN